MRLPHMKRNVGKTQKYVINFGGINKCSNYSEGELESSLNLSSDLLPFISQRGSRAVLHSFERPTALHTHNGIAVVDGNTFFYKAEGDTEFLEKATVTEGKKQLAQQGNNLIILPDKLCYDVKNDKVYPLQAEYRLSVREYVNNTQTYKYYTKITSSKTLTVSDIGTEILYDANARNQGQEVYDLFAVGDIVQFSGMYMEHKQTSDFFHLEGIEAELKKKSYSNGTATFTFADGTFDDANLDNYTLESRHITITKNANTDKETYNLEHIFASGERLWGVEGQTIKASAYKNIKNFMQFEGLSSDSYSIECSTPGEFTGACAYTSHLVFFKANYIHRIYGSRPSNYSMVVSEVPGVEKGSGHSIRMIKDRLFYKGTDGIYMYAGDVPVLISEKLGKERYTDAVAGACGDKYYISMKNQSGVYELFVYDMRTGTFFKEDNTEFIDTAQMGGELLYIDQSGGLKSIGEDGDGSEEIEWYAELRPFNEVYNEKKGYSQLTMRVELDEGAYMNVETAFDEERFDLVKTLSRPGKSIICIPVAPNRSDCFRVKLSGKGGCRVMNMVREFSGKREVR